MLDCIHAESRHISQPALSQNLKKWMRSGHTVVLSDVTSPIDSLILTIARHDFGRKGNNCFLVFEGQFKPLAIVTVTLSEFEGDNDEPLMGLNYLRRANA